MEHFVPKKACETEETVKIMWPQQSKIVVARARGGRRIRAANRERALKVRYGMLDKYPGPGSHDKDSR
jgi:hypothetical protein